MKFYFVNCNYSDIHISNDVKCFGTPHTFFPFPLVGGFGTNDFVRNCPEVCVFAEHIPMGLFGLTVFDFMQQV